MKDNSFSIHAKNIQSLAIKIYKFLNGPSPTFLDNVFHKNISNFIPEILKQLDLELKLFHI